MNHVPSDHHRRAKEKVIIESTTAGSPLNIVLFSGTDDKLQAAAILTAGAAALGRPVNLSLQYQALEASGSSHATASTRSSSRRPTEAMDR